MNFPPDFDTLILLLAVIAIILIVSSGMISSYRGKVNILINKKKLRNVAIGAAIAFPIFVTIRLIMNMILN